jgi:hypothetical protein
MVKYFKRSYNKVFLELLCTTDRVVNTQLLRIEDGLADTAQYLGNSTTLKTSNIRTTPLKEYVHNKLKADELCITSI